MRNNQHDPSFLQSEADTEVCYDLSDWTVSKVKDLEKALTSNGISFSWDTVELVVCKTDETVVDAYVDAIESGKPISEVEIDSLTSSGHLASSGLQQQQSAAQLSDASSDYRYDITTNAMTRKAGDKTYAARIIVWLALCGILSLGVSLIAAIPGAGLPIAAVIVIAFQLRRWGLF